MKDIVSVREGVFYPNTIRVKTIVGLIVGVYKLILLDSTQVQLSLYIVLHRLWWIMFIMLYGNQEIGAHVYSLLFDLSKEFD